MKKILLIAISLVLAANVVFAKPKRGAVELSAYLTVTDADVVCKDIIGQILKSPRIERFAGKIGRDPVVTIGKIKDETGEFFDTQIIANSLKTAIIKSGLLEFMANKDVRDELRGEVAEQSEHANLDQAKSMDNEDAADFMLTGSVKLSVQTNGKKQERTYSVNIELNDLETHRTVDMFEPSDEVKEYLHKSDSVKSR